jgi:hypothetical protein
VLSAVNVCVEKLERRLRAVAAKVSNRSGNAEARWDAVARSACADAAGGVLIESHTVETEELEPAFASSADPELWVMLLEKAYAKYVGDRAGGYAVLNAGLVHDGLVAMTGGASEEIDVRVAAAGAGAETLWNRLCSYSVAGFLMGAGSHPGDDTVHASIRGIVQGHAFSIGALHEIDIGGGGGSQRLRLILLRNPWGTTPDTDAPYDWAPTSPTWRQRGGTYTATKLGCVASVASSVCAQVRRVFYGFRVRSYDPSAPPAGKFWMAWEDFIRAYATVFVCRCVRAEG